MIKGFKIEISFQVGKVQPEVCVVKTSNQFDLSVEVTGRNRRDKLNNVKFDFFLNSEIQRRLFINFVKLLPDW